MIAVGRDRLDAAFEDMVAIGNRFPGSWGESASREYVEQRFRTVGLTDVRMETVSYLGCTPRAASCFVAGPGGERALRATGLQYSAAGRVEAEAVYVGAWSERERRELHTLGVGLDGKIALLESGFPAVVCQDLVERGAVGIVNIGGSADRQVAHLTARFYPQFMNEPWDNSLLGVPGVTIGAEDGREILGSMTRGSVTLRLDHEIDYTRSQTANVCGDVAGTGEDDECIVVGAHYDTQAAGPGAWDNATGIAALLAIATSWRERPPERGVTFVAFAAEELGLWGAHAFVQARKETTDRIIGMVNLDALGPRLPAQRMLAADDAIAALSFECASAAGWVPSVTVDASVRPSADYAPFLDFGVPACGLKEISPQHPYYHTERDLPEYVDMDRVHVAAQASAAIAYRLAATETPRPGRARRQRRWATESGQTQGRTG